MATGPGEIRQIIERCRRRSSELEGWETQPQQ
jgi:hypothetical protein